MRLLPASEQHPRLDLVEKIEAALTALPGDRAFLWWWDTITTLSIRQYMPPTVPLNLTLADGGREVMVRWSTSTGRGGPWHWLSIDAAAELAANLLAYGREDPGAIDMLAALAGAS